METVRAMLATLLLSWLAVTQDCHGAPELAVTYSVRTELETLEGWATAPDGSLQPVVSREFHAIATPVASLSIPDPGVDQMIAYWDPIAIDAAGNTSEDPCP